MDIVGFVKNATNNLSPERYNTALQQTVKIIVKLISDSITMKRVIEHKKYIATLNDYLREVICVCPKCDGPARITADSKYALPWRPYDVKLVCLKCPHRESWPSQKWKSDFVHYNPSSGYEPYFGYQLYFQEPVGQNNLAIFSKKHFADLTEYIEAKHKPSPENRKWSMVNRLPKWIKLSKNRTAVIRALNRIKTKIEKLV